VSDCRGGKQGNHDPNEGDHDTGDLDEWSRPRWPGKHNKVRQTQTTPGKGEDDFQEPVYLATERTTDCGHRWLRDVFGQRGRLNDVKRGERNLCHPSVTTQSREQGLDWMLSHDLLRTQCAKEENPCLLIEAKEVVEPFERLAVTPLQIIKEQQQRLRRKQNRSRCQLSRSGPL